MKAQIMTYENPVQSAEYRKYEVDSSRCALEICDLVTPETTIGWHYSSDQLIRAGLHGHVATIYYNPMHNSLIITVTTSKLR
jgi:hypothetical protein